MRKYFIPAATAAIASAAVAQADDPYLWLEEIEGEKAIGQVKQWNAETEAMLTAMAGFEERKARALKLLNDPNQIATPSEVRLPPGTVEAVRAFATPKSVTTADPPEMRMFSGLMSR